jgi:hypothetical protein
MESSPGIHFLNTNKDDFCKSSKISRAWRSEPDDLSVTISACRMKLIHCPCFHFKNNENTFILPSIGKPVYQNVDM